MAQVFLLSTITGNGAESEQVNVILRHLNKRGNNVTLYDMSLLNENLDAEDLKKQIEIHNLFEVIESADAIVLVTDEYCALLTQVIQSLFTINSKRVKRSSNVWFHNGLSCTILGGSVKKSRVAKHLWEVFSEEQNELDLTDIFPYGSPRPYVLDYTKETAQPTVV